MQTAQQIIDAEARELVRRQGIDPVATPAAVRSLVSAVVSDYQDRAVTANLPPLLDADATARAVVDAVSGLGPLQPYLDDAEVEEIWINSPERVFVARRGRSELTTLILTHDQVYELVERMLRPSGRRIDLSTPFVDATLPDGSRVHIVIPNVTRRHMAVNIRKFVLGINSLDELVDLGALTPAAARFLESSVVAGLNVLVAGGTQAGSNPRRCTLPPGSASEMCNYCILQRLLSSGRGSRCSGPDVPLTPCHQQTRQTHLRQLIGIPPTRGSCQLRWRRRSTSPETWWLCTGQCR